MVTVLVEDIKIWMGYVFADQSLLFGILFHVFLALLLNIMILQR